ncbi:hypothetical protein TcCL_NonESM03526 [Trypanosoma cruzi]|nr:hypothetical protein TcCL_NonESM03526 [Trypanosoma cruzi]
MEECNDERGKRGTCMRLLWNHQRPRTDRGMADVSTCAVPFHCQRLPPHLCRDELRLLFYGIPAKEEKATSKKKKTADGRGEVAPTYGSVLCGLRDAKMVQFFVDCNGARKEKRELPTLTHAHI